MRNALLLTLWATAVLLTACGHKKQARVTAPPPPQSRQSQPPADARIGATETGIASWYGHPYHGRQAADGEIYDMETLVAAHRTLPFQTWVRVYNLRNHKTVDVRIIDRGPFIDGRIIDLSHAAAEAIDLVGPGIGPVRIEVIPAPAYAAATHARVSPPRPAAPVRVAQAPPAVAPPPATVLSPAAVVSPAVPAVPPSSPGTFAVQVGMYLDRPTAERVRAEMAARYGSARIVRRDGLHDMWRVLVGSVPTEDAANTMSDRIRQESGERNAFVVRLDSY